MQNYMSQTLKNKLKVYHLYCLVKPSNQNRHSYPQEQVCPTKAVQGSRRVVLIAAAARAPQVRPLCSENFRFREVSCLALPPAISSNHWPCRNVHFYWQQH
ncbi:hypothetical protein CEXT_612831 [Caerostris extrusa]|uniref:Uncharacterized protein n=1 Tax=Caerostris extrusa TaxID=172846 RepID=A0AAV4QZ65_CAEEX|nr:hypothetical protein CEXT_612831 [Caerostris extrusa]